MGYYNPILAYGIDAFTRDAAQAGADGFIVVDLPPEESDAMREACIANGLRLIYLLAPTSTDKRIQLVATLASGFIYCLSLTGVTGARDDLQRRAGRIRRARAPPHPLANRSGIWYI